MLDLPDDIRNAAVFLAQNGMILADDETTLPQSGVLPRATAFMVTVPATDGSQDEGYSYLVTAKHCLIEGSIEIDPILVRLNDKKGSYIDVELPPRNDWFEHDTSDVAVVPFDPPLDSIFMPISWDLLMSEDEQMAPREGAEVAFVSLFSQHVGAKRSLPIVRTGSIALLPHESVVIGMGLQQTANVKAYLIESLSWGGCSGAPTFVELNGSIRLLGLINGHKESTRSVTFDGGSTQIPINAGIAIVIPASHILDLLGREDVQLDRQGKKAKSFKQAFVIAPVTRSFEKKGE